jgi:hypothetical protein
MRVWLFRRAHVGMTNLCGNDGQGHDYDWEDATVGRRRSCWSKYGGVNLPMVPPLLFSSTADGPVSKSSTILVQVRLITDSVRGTGPER